MEKYLINPNHKISKISKDIYGHFSEHLGRCIYNGVYVGENSKIPNINGMRCDVVNALKDMGLPVLRWPGGCFADEYHWKDGIGPKENRKKMVNTHWGGVVEDNSFGTHEYFELCRQLGCDSYINGNVGSGTVAEMNEWVEYMTFDGISPMAQLRKENGQDKPWKIKYFGVGNESWGCGGNMDPEYYGCLYKRYNTYVRDYDSNNRIKRIACGPNGGDYHWTREVMDKVKHHAQGIALHYYTVPGDSWDHKGSATDFTVDEYYKTVCKAYHIEELINNHIAVMDSINPQKWVQLIVDEWGTWYDVEPGTNPGFLYQQNTMRDAVVAALTLNIFNKHSDRIMMANIAQTVNVLQAVILTDGDEMLLTPTYHVFKMYKEHQENTLLGSYITTDEIKSDSAKMSCPKLIESASIDDNGVIYSTVTNVSETESAEIKCQIADTDVSEITAEILTGDIHDKNDFNDKENVTVKEFKDFTKLADGFTAVLPPCSVVKFVIK
ncbi:MAG: alpha-L-arabinofuranosidase C-terminal domain-containing protein [Eubacteriales bacterium]|nr:alpha-L-arabinofuranosidase C-terminal domain-containing protein [Eubacteriales bacterium]